MVLETAGLSLSESSFVNDINPPYKSSCSRQNLPRSLSSLTYTHIQMLTLLLVMQMSRTVRIILMLTMMMTNYIPPEMDRHDGANTQEEPFNLSQRLATLSVNDVKVDLI